MRYHYRKMILWSLIGAIFGFLIGLVIQARAFDPCDPNNESSKYTYEKRGYNPDDDAAMQFKWKDHQPTLRSR